MRSLFISILFVLSACTAGEDKLPSSSNMETQGEINQPVQVESFCGENPEFEQC